jgi:hypothetical protein
VKQRLKFAVRDNVELCAAVCRAHGIASREQDGLWRTLAPAPPYYPDAITTDAKLSSEHVARVLAEIGGTSIKDSYAALDLTPHGFDFLFRADWIWLEPGTETAPGTLEWRPVTDAADLAEWRAAHGSADSILPAGLAEQGLTVLRGRDETDSVVGAVVSELAGVIGVSNVFARGLTVEAAWHELVARLRADWPSLPVVGYESGEELDAAIAAGFEPIGPLQVWLKRA